MKRIIDLFFAVFFILLFSVPFMALYLILFFKLNGKVFFLQERVGLNNKIFKLCKLRTMSDCCDESGNLLPDHQRLSPLGIFLRATSLDELPGLWNVLKGDMSLVGPRPLLVEYLPLYNAQQARRHEVRPGITGWAQVNGRNAISWEKKFELDVWYVDHQSLRLDIRILWLTVKKVLVRDGISAEGEATMSKFTGTKAP